MDKEYQTAPDTNAGIQAPKLKAFRPLQAYALACALVWLLGGALITQKLADQNLSADLLYEEKNLIKETGHILNTLEQTMHQAEQLSKTLSFDRSIISLAKLANQQTAQLEALDPAKRVDFTLNLPAAPAVNSLFAQLAQHIETEQLFALSKTGYCIGSSRADQPDGCIGVNYFTRDYFQAAKTHGSGRQFAIGRVHPTPSFFFSTAIKDADEFAGVIVVRQKVGQIVRFLAQQNLRVAVTDKNGVVLSSNQEDLLFQQIAADGQALPSKSDIQRIFQRDTLRILPLKFIASPQPELKLVALDGKRYLLFGSALQAGDFLVYVFSPIEPLFFAQQKYWATGGIIIVLGLLIILLIERNINYTQHRLAHLNALSAANHSLALASQELYFLSVTDVLTGIANRRYFTQRLKEEIDRRLRAETAPNQPDSTLALLAIDIDFFKAINDTHGHPAGDQAICALASICKNTIRPYDILGRVGGEEFAVLLIDTTATQAEEIAERIRSVCETSCITVEKAIFNQTCSIGLALYQPGETAEQFLSHADRALYAAKNTGRNCVQVFNQPSAQPQIN